MTEHNGPWARPPEPPPPRGGRTALWALLFAGLLGIILALAHAFPEAVRTHDDWANVAYAAGLVVVVSAGLFRFGPGRWAQHLRHAAIWTVLVAVLALGFAYKDVFADAPQRLQLAFSAGDPVRTRGNELVIPQDEQGSYVIVGKVNGQRVSFVVDTGSTETVLTPDDAQRLGVDLAKVRFDEKAETANGTGLGAAYTARTVEVGPIRLADFPMAINQAPMSSSLLGMTFLDRLASFEVRDRKLILKWRDPPPS